MMFNNAANELATWLALGGVIPAALGMFTFIFGKPRTWWHSWLGWTIALLLFSMTAILTLALIRRLGGLTDGFEVSAILVYGLLMLALWLVFVMILVERRKGRTIGFVPAPTSNEDKTPGSDAVEK